jgi:hypothetical protein
MDKIIIISDVRLDKNNVAGNKTAILSFINILADEKQIFYLNLNVRKPEKISIKCNIINLGFLYKFFKYFNFLYSFKERKPLLKRVVLFDTIVALIVRFYKINIVIIEYLEHAYLIDKIDLDVIKIADIHDLMHRRSNSFKAIGVQPPFNFNIDEKEELKLLKKFNGVIAIQRSDYYYLRENSIISACIPRVTLSFKKSKIPNINYGLCCGFIAGDSYVNSRALNTVLEIAENCPKVKFVIAGSIKIPEKLPVNVFSIGQIDDLNNFYNIIHCTLNPVEVGSGLKIKTVESLSFGKPCIGSSLAFEGIEFGKGDYFIECNTLIEYIDSLVGIENFDINQMQNRMFCGWKLNLAPNKILKEYDCFINKLS